MLGLGGAPDTSYLVQAQATGQNAPPDQCGEVRGLQFSSTFERNGGGTSWHWLGTSLRELENDIRMKTKYDHAVDWPVTYERASAVVGESGKRDRCRCQHDPTGTARSRWVGVPAGLSISDGADSDEHRGPDDQPGRLRITGAGHAARYARRFGSDRCTTCSSRQLRPAAIPSLTTIDAFAPAIQIAFPSVLSRLNGIRQ